MGKDMKDLFLSQVKILQVSKRCLEQIPAVELTVELPQEICHSSCEQCLANGKVCEKKQPSHIHSLHACQKCIDDGEQHVVCVVLVLITDCEKGNKKAMELISKMQEDDTIGPTLKHLSFFPDSGPHQLTHQQQ